MTMSTADSVAQAFVAQAKAGQPVWISAVRNAFDGLPPAGSWVLQCQVTGLDDVKSYYDLRLPRLDGLPDAEREFVTEFFLSTMYNILSSVGASWVDFVTDGDLAPATELVAAFDRAFGVGATRASRTGYGRCVNVIERMLEANVSRRATGDGPTVFGRSLTRGLPWPAPEQAESVRGNGIAEVCRTALRGMDDTTLLGIDVGGTDIKVALCRNGRLGELLEYDWFPASFTRIEQLIDPIVLIVRLMRLVALTQTDPQAAVALDPILEKAMSGAAPLDVIEDAVLRGEAVAPTDQGGSFDGFDGIGMCFPDVVMHDKIVGGEVYKTRGIRTNPDIDYEASLRLLRDLDVELSRFVRQDGVVGILNDGPMAAFTAAAELCVDSPADIADGVFAHTLGTELGTGWIMDDGLIPDIPLEVYNCVIDLGSHPERLFEADDVRSVLNFNTGVPGTLQKYTSQSGVFRLALKYLPDADPATLADLCERGYLERRDEGWYVPTEPVDQRKPFLEHMMRLAGQPDNEVARRIFSDIGEFLAVAWQESRWLMHPRADRRVLFGRVVKHPACFDLMVEGARAVAPELELVVADDTLACSSLMKQLQADPRYTVAQFAQAIGAVHYANLRLSTARTADPRTAPAGK